MHMRTLPTFGEELEEAVSLLHYFFPAHSTLRVSA
jgi:hypothetical protein